MAFEFQIPADSVSDSVFLGTRHLNWIDKITSHIIQMNLNPQSLNFRVSDSKVSNRVLGLRSFRLGSETRSRRLGA